MTKSVTQKKNIVILKTDDSTQSEISAGIVSDFAVRFPEYELIVISEEEYRGVFSFFKKRIKRFAIRVLPRFFRWMRDVRSAHYERRLDKNGRIWAHFSDPNKINEGAKSGLKVIRNITYRFKPKCVVTLDPALLARTVAAKRKFDLNTKIVSVLYDSYFDVRNMFFGVNKYAVLSANTADKILSYGVKEERVDEVRIFAFSKAGVLKSAKRAELGMENDATFMVVASYEARKKFKGMIADIAAASEDFNILVYCGGNEKLSRYFERVKVELNLFRMKLADDFDAYAEASDYILTAPNIRAVNRSFSAGAIPIVYNNRQLPESRNAQFYIEKKLVQPVSERKEFAACLNKLMSSIAAESELKAAAEAYLASLPVKAVADVVYEAARRLDAEQEIK